MCPVKEPVWVVFAILIFFFFLIYLKICRTVIYVQRRIYGLFRWTKRFLFCTVSACVAIKDGVCVRYLNELCVCVCVRENKKSFNVRIIRFTTESTLRVRILLFIRKNSIRKRLHTFVINRINFFFLLYITFVEYRVFLRVHKRVRVRTSYWGVFNARRHFQIGT